MNKLFLITRPNHEVTTRYLFAWSGKIVQWAYTKSINVVSLEKEKAHRAELESRLKKLNPAFVVLNGHGNESLVTGHDNEPLIIADVNDILLKDKIIYALSCSSASILFTKLLPIPSL